MGETTTRQIFARFRLSRKTPRISKLMIFGAGCMAAGCVNSEVPAPAAQPPVMEVRTQTGAREQSSPQRAALSRAQPKPATAQELTDACAMRMHDISGYLLLYYTQYKRLPQTLEELAPLAEGDEEFSLVCPTSGKPYIFVPQGLGGAEQGRPLLMYEATSAHNGIRWGMVADPTASGEPLMTYVIPLSDAKLLQYTGGASPAGPSAR